MLKKALFWGGMVAVIAVVSVGLMEIVLRLFLPQAYMMPRFAYSEEYGFVLPPSTEIVAERQGHWKFLYTTDKNGHRATSSQSPASGQRERTVVLLGDSYSFGFGVNDGEEYAAVANRLLAGRARIVNLGVGGYGLPQEIKRYRDYGAPLSPSVVLINFALNDPDDGASNPVTVVENGRLAYKLAPLPDQLSLFAKKFLRNSVIQYSHAYNFLRALAYRHVRKKAESRVAGDDKQRAYSLLLEVFARNLKENDVQLVFFAIDGQLKQAPLILESVLDLQKKGLLTYLDSDLWFEGETDIGSPEGHAWGTKGHRIAARKLSIFLSGMVSPQGQ